MHIAPGAARDARAPGAVRVFAAAFAVVFAAMAAWSLAMPLFSAPDEPTHVMRAAAIDRGELLGELVDGPASPIGKVELPEYYANVRSSPNCYHTRPETPASCAPPVPRTCPEPPIPRHPPCRVGFIYNARYPPLYYAIVGLPSLLGAGDWAVYLMRLVSAALSSIFVALAITAAIIWSRSRALLVGIVVAATPMVIYLGGVVNPSSLEIAAALCVWTCGVLLVVSGPADAPPGLIITLAAAAATFVAVRGLSPFWLGLCALVLVASLEWGRSGLVAFVRRRVVRAGAAGVLAVGIAAVVWIVKEHTLLVFSLTKVPASTPLITVLETSFAHNDFYVPDMVGVFGAFDTWAPTFTYLVWYGLIGYVVIEAASRARARHRLLLGAMVAAIVCIPVAISSSQAYVAGYVWQGRDTLPFAIGLPVLAAGLAGERLRPRHAGSSVALLAALAQFGAFYEALRRYAVGTTGPDFGFLTAAPWHGPLPNLAAVVLEAVVLAVGYVLVARAIGRGRTSDEPTAAPAAPVAAEVA